MNASFSNKFWPFTFYLLFFSGAAALYNFLALFFQSKGLPGSQIGVLTGISSLIALFSGPLWSGVADAAQRHRLVLTIAMLGNIITVFLYPQTNVFLGFLVLIAIQALFGGPVISMVDNATVTMLGDQKALYGRVRLGGTIGWGLMSAVMGLVVERTGLQWNFLIYCGFFAIALLVSQQLRFSPHTNEGSFAGGVRELLSDRVVETTVVAPVRDPRLAAPPD